MSDELEKRLRAEVMELFDARTDLMESFYRAARIGAEIEREAIARGILDGLIGDFEYDTMGELNTYEARQDFAYDIRGRKTRKETT